MEWEKEGNYNKYMGVLAAGDVNAGSLAFRIFNDERVNKVFKDQLDREKSRARGVITAKYPKQPDENEGHVKNGPQLGRKK